MEKVRGGTVRPVPLRGSGLYPIPRPDAGRCSVSPPEFAGAGRIPGKGGSAVPASVDLNGEQRDVVLVIGAVEPVADHGVDQIGR